MTNAHITSRLRKGLETVMLEIHKLVLHNTQSVEADSRH